MNTIQVSEDINFMQQIQPRPQEYKEIAKYQTLSPDKDNYNENEIDRNEIKEVKYKKMKSQNVLTKK